MHALTLRVESFLKLTLITAAVLLGAIWPSVYTIGAVLVLPAVPITLLGIVWPTAGRTPERYLRRCLERYVSASALLSALMVSFEAVYLVVTAM